MQRRVVSRPPTETRPGVARHGGLARLPNGAGCKVVNKQLISVDYWTTPSDLICLTIALNEETEARWHTLHVLLNTACTLTAEAAPKLIDREDVLAFHPVTCAVCKPKATWL